MRADAPPNTAVRMSPEVSPMRSQTTTCSIPDCNGRHEARGWCDKHYQRWQRHGDPLFTLTPGLDQTDAERFATKVVLLSTGCKIWIAARDSHGYGRFKVDGTMVQAHRWAYEQANGSIPEGLTLDHLCRNRACVEVTHLEPVTHRVNILRGVGPTAQNARKTHCKRGHPFTLENTYTRLGGKRQCRQCRRAHQKRWVGRVKGAKQPRTVIEIWRVEPAGEGG